MSYIIDTSQHTGEPKYCCPVMDIMIDEGYLENVMMLSGKVSPPAIPGPKLSRTGHKSKSPILVAFCPWCGKKLTEGEPKEKDGQ